MDKTDKVLSRSVVEVLPNKDGLAKLMAKKKICLYLGVDPSGTQLHLGHAVVLRKLRQFQDLGHKVILLIGDFTGMIGDPTDKSATRKKLTKDQVLENAKTYKDQASKILSFKGENPVEIKFNSEWLSRLNFEEILELSSNLTVQQLEERDMFVKRRKEGKPIYLHEFLYPVMQGYDSVEMEVDLEVGGTDQTFNMLIGRHLLKTLKGKEKYVLTVPLLLGTDGEKMGKSTGNFIALTSEPKDMYNKIMSLRDDLVRHYFDLATDVDLNSIDFNKNPMELKKDLAFEIVKMYHGESEANKAKSLFGFMTHPSTQAPTSLPTIYVQSGTHLPQFLQDHGYASSASVAKQMINTGSVDINNVPITDRGTVLQNNQILKIGKQEIVRVQIEKPDDNT